MEVTVAGVSLSEQNYLPDGKHTEIASIYY